MTFLFKYVLCADVLILQQVKYIALRAGAEAQFMEVDGSKSLNATLTGLRKFTQYNIQVLASTRVGDGVLSNVITVRTASDGKTIFFRLYKIQQSRDI